MPSYDLSEAIWICAYHDGEPWHICPECVDHFYCHDRPDGHVNCDCKNAFTIPSGKFTEDGREIKEIFGQCMCYSEVHGVR